MVWAHVMSMGSAMMSPFDYREVMKAHFRYNETRTVEEVLAEQEARDKARDRKGRGKVDPNKPPEPGRAATPKELELLRKMMQGTVPAPGAE